MAIPVHRTYRVDGVDGRVPAVWYQDLRLYRSRAWAGRPTDGATGPIPGTGCRAKTEDGLEQEAVHEHPFTHPHL